MPPVVGNVGTAEGRTRVLESCPSPDILANNAAGPPPGSTRSGSDSDWNNALAANLHAPVAMIAAVIDGMASREFGLIINITSGAAKSIQSTALALAPPRAGVHGMVAPLF